MCGSALKDFLAIKYGVERIENIRILDVFVIAFNCKPRPGSVAHSFDV